MRILKSIQFPYSINQLIFLLFGLFWLFTPQNVNACLEANWPGIEEKTTNADIVFEGIVWSTSFTGISDLYPNDKERVIFNAEYDAVIIVNRYIKGTGPSLLTVSDFGPSFHCAGTNGAVSENKLFFIIEEENTHSISNGLKASQDFISESIIAANQPPKSIIAIPGSILSKIILFLRSVQFFSPILIIIYMLKIKPEKFKFQILMFAFFVITILNFTYPFSIFLDFITPTYILVLLILLIPILKSQFKRMKPNL